MRLSLLAGAVVLAACVAIGDAHALSIATLGPIVSDEGLAALAPGPADYSVALSDGLLVVGGLSTTKTPQLVSVAAYDIATRAKRFDLLPPDPALTGGFGDRVVADAGVIAVTQVSPDGAFPSRVHFYDAADGSHQRTHEPFAQWFGDLSVAIDAGRYVVGSVVSDQFAGAQVFDLASGTPGAEVRLSDHSGELHAGEPIAVDLEGSDVLVGVRRWDGQAYRASGYLFAADSGVSLGRLASGPERPLIPRSFSGAPGVAIEGGLAVVGSPETASALVFNVGTGDQLSEVFPDNEGRFPRFGRELALDEGVVVASNPGENNSGPYGVSYVFDAISGDRLARLPDGGSVIFRSGVAVDGGVIATSGPRAPQIKLHRVVPEPGGLALAAVACLCGRPRRRSRTVGGKDSPISRRPR